MMTNENMNNTEIIQALLLIKGVNRKTIQKIYQHIGNFDDIEKILFFLTQFNQTNISKQQFQTYLVKSRNALQDIETQGIQTLNFLDERYPEQLKLISDFPVLIFIKGHLSILKHNVNVALVGTRKPSSIAERAAHLLGLKFSEHQCNIISGLANGCDALAHESSINSGGKTLAVLPCGLNNIFPRSNADLANHIVESGGAIVSEYPINHRPFKTEYIDRNRIISAFSDLVVVIESGLQGGTMHTANYALEQHKLLACFHRYKKGELPGGNAMLIQEKGAIAISTEKDILDLIEIAKKRKTMVANTNTAKPNPSEKQLSFFNINN